jgi:excisionase family DNA binding protein
MTSPWLTPTQAAEYLSLSEGHLANLRSEGTGPKFAKQGRVIRYSAAALDAWLVPPSNVTELASRRSA